MRLSVERSSIPRSTTRISRLSPRNGATGTGSTTRQCGWEWSTTKAINPNTTLEMTRGIEKAGKLAASPESGPASVESYGRSRRSSPAPPLPADPPTTRTTWRKSGGRSGRAVWRPADGSYRGGYAGERAGPHRGNADPSRESGGSPESRSFVVGSSIDARSRGVRE